VKLYLDFTAFYYAFPTCEITPFGDNVSGLCGSGIPEAYGGYAPLTGIDKFTESGID
jgi:hypothetical protein